MATFFETGVVSAESVIFDIVCAGNRQKKKEVLKKHQLYFERSFPTAIVYHALATNLKQLESTENQVLDLKSFLTGQTGRWNGIKACREEIRVQCPQLNADVKERKSLAEILATYPEHLSFYVPPKVAVKISYSRGCMCWTS